MIRAVLFDLGCTYAKIQRAYKCFTRGTGTQYRIERIKMKEGEQ